MASVPEHGCRGGAVASYRGEVLGSRKLSRLQRIVDRCAGQTRAEIALEACRRFGWRRAGGDWAVVSCRALLLRLDRRGLIRLPPPLQQRREGRKRGPRTLPSQPMLGPPPELPYEQPTGPLEVRPIGAEEQAGWRLYMERYHYLGCGRLVGESLRYAAFVGGELVALLGWAAAALRNGPRDRYIGWDAAIRARKLALVTCNVRFLILPWIRMHNLASQILGANLRRLRRDWQVAYNHPVLLAETFVDVSRFRGTCYRASNWLELGQTRGFSRIGASYQANGRPKAVFVYPLDRRARQRLQADDSPAGGDNKEVNKMVKLNFSRLPLDGRGGLIEVLRGLDDPRHKRGVRFPIVSIMAIAVCATLAGAQSLAAIAEWAKDQSIATLRRLWCRKGKPPSESTIRRVLSTIDVGQLDQRAGRWLAGLTSLAGEGLAIDGKTLRGSKDGDSKAVHLVAAVLHREGVVLAQHRVPDKTNEIKSVEPLFGNLDIKEAVVTGDAMFAQKKIAEHVVRDKQADYLLFVKDNQPTLRQDIEDLELEAFPPSAHHAG